VTENRWTGPCESQGLRPFLMSIQDGHRPGGQDDSRARQVRIVFAARKGRGALAQLDVAELHPRQGVELVSDCRNVLEVLPGLSEGATWLFPDQKPTYRLREYLYKNVQR